jgi:hypothetical protein
MHRSRQSVLAIFAAVAACSTHDDSGGNAMLSQDRTLVARLEETRPVPLPDACGAIAVAAHPTAANQHQAEELTRQALVAEMHSKEQEAEALLRRASDLDGSNKSAAYHLGRTSEALGDRTAALTAYCRYLALTPTTAESAEARQRVAKLSQSVTRVASGTVIDSAPTRRHAQAAPARRITREHSAGVERSVLVTSHERITDSAVTVDADRSATRREVPIIDPPSTASRAESRRPSRAQSAGIGAAAGAMIGAATGRSVKSAVIGAAAGGILGSMVGRETRPVGGGSRL